MRMTMMSGSKKTTHRHQSPSLDHDLRSESVAMLRVANKWEQVGRAFGGRPLTVFGSALGAVIYSIVVGMTM